VPTSIDHLLWGSPDLDLGVDRFEALTGVRATSGGAHQGWGSRNALVGLGNSYLEIIAPDPHQDGGAVGDQLAGLAEPAMVSWAARTTNTDELIGLAGQAGYRTTTHAMSRLRADGVNLTWIIVQIHDHGGGPLVPFFIDWLGSPHPTEGLDADLRLSRFTLETPDPGTLKAVLDALECTGVAVERSDITRYVARLSSPAGAVELTGSGPFVQFARATE